MRAIISTGFADIFRNNSLKNGLLPIVVDPETHARLTALLNADPDAEVSIDLAELGLLLPDGMTVDFDIDPFARAMLLAGTDEIGWVMERSAAIDAWEAANPGRVDTRPVPAPAG